MIEQLSTWVYKIFEHYGVMGLFLSMIIENLGIPFPIEIGYVVALALILSGKYSLLFILFLLTLGHVVGSVISYGIGSMGSSWLQKIIKKSVGFSKVYGHVHMWYEKYGTLTIFWTRFIGYVRPWSSLVAGLADFPFVPFLLYTVIGSFLFNAGALAVSWGIVLFWKRYTNFHFLILSVLTILFFWTIGYGLFYKKKNTQNKNTEKK